MEEFNSKYIRSILSVNNMVMNHHYIVCQIKKCKTRFGDKIQIVTDNHLIYLPQRFNNLSDAALEEINSNDFALIKTPGDGKNYNLKLEKYCKYKNLAINTFQLIEFL